MPAADYASMIPATVARDIDGWRTHPDLKRLRASLHAHSDRHTFLNAYAEAMVARQLLAHGCELRFEVPTPNGRRADFEVQRDDLRFFLHVKRLSTRGPAKARLTVSSRLRILERINRPYIVGVRLREGLSDRQMQHLVTEAEKFIQHARVGDELTVHDETSTSRGVDIGGVRIMAPGEHAHVTVVIALPSESESGSFTDESPRMRKLLRKAYLQFMPKAANVILMGTSHERDIDTFETALLGSHIERWDAPPPSGRRIAHGRAEDGFWHGQRYEASHAAGWFRFSPKQDEFRSKLWLRSEQSTLSSELKKLLQELFA